MTYISVVTTSWIVADGDEEVNPLEEAKFELVDVTPAGPDDDDGKLLPLDTRVLELDADR